VSFVLDCPRQQCALIYKERRHVRATQRSGHPLIILPQLIWWVEKCGWVNGDSHLTGRRWKTADCMHGSQLLLASNYYQQAQCEPRAPSRSPPCQHTGPPAYLKGAGSCRLLKIFPPPTWLHRSRPSVCSSWYIWQRLRSRLFARIDLFLAHLILAPCTVWTG